MSSAESLAAHWVGARHLPEDVMKKIHSEVYSQISYPVTLAKILLLIPELDRTAHTHLTVKLFLEDFMRYCQTDVRER